MGKIYMVPLPIGEQSTQEMDSTKYTEVVCNTRIWIAENARTTRRYLSGLKKNIAIEALEIFELSRDYSIASLHSFLETHIPKSDIAVTSEAGLAGMADPGGVAALWAHKNGIDVVSLCGPGSVYLSLAGSGLNGQQFSFHGYPPIKEPELSQFIVGLAIEVKKSNYTQIIIETPYRSDRTLKSIIDHCPDEMYLCIASQLQTAESLFQTKKIKAWKQKLPEIGKKPTVFLLGIPA